MTSSSPHDSKTKLLGAAQHSIRAQGYAATTVDTICATAGVTKGSFFHHFKSKDELALAAVDHFSALAEALFTSAPYHRAKDPLDRLLGYIDFRMSLLDRELPALTCLLGTLVQETYHTHPAIRAACDNGMAAHIAELTRDLGAAKKLYAPSAAWIPQSVGYFIQSVLQGFFIFAKAKLDTKVAHENLAHLKRYLRAMFPPLTTATRKRKV